MVETILAPYINNYQKPILIYDLGQISKKMNFLTNICRDSPIKMLFTVKSFPCREVIDLAYEIMPGFEISNINEYQLLPKDIHDVILSINDPTGQLNASIPIELSQKNTCYLHMDVIDEDKLLSFNFRPKIHYGARVSHTSLIGSKSYVKESRFGSSIIKLAKHKKFFFNGKLTGLHVHNGSEENTIDDYLIMADQIVYFLKKENIKISFVNLGGGLHLLTEKEIEELIQRLTPSFIDHNLQGFFEPGQSVVRHAGYALGKILSIKQFSQEKYHLVLDLSNECHIKWSDPVLLNKGQLDSLDSPQKLTVFIGGPTCFEHDCLGILKVDPVDGKLPFKLNEILTFGNINGYAAAWNMAFNGISKASLAFC
ncbi:MAG: hypothetical protein ABSA84_08130 [Gammaproteobacteria bacterium]|jgi:diaminopimelate decarboxylase